MGTTYVKTGGAWKQLAQGSAIKIAGSWVNLAAIHVKDGGTWKSVHSAANDANVSLPALTTYTYSSTGSLVYTGVYFQYRGEFDKRTYSTASGGALVDSGSWYTGRNAPSNAYEIRATVTSGSLSGQGQAGGTWYPLGYPFSGGALGDIAFLASTTTIGSSTVSITVEIRRIGSGTVLATRSYTFTATRTS